MVLQLNQIEKSFGHRLLFRLPSLTVYDGQRIGIVGRNGEGKTTLLSLVAGEQRPDAGRIVVKGKVAYMKQVARHEQPCSGGEAVRARWRAALDEGADLLLADEPTANLDEAGQQAVEAELAAFGGVVLLISHDRALLDAVCDTIWELEKGDLRVYSGNYSDYKAHKQRELAGARDDYEQYIAERDRLRDAIRGRATAAQGIRNAPKRMGNSEARLHRRSGTEIAEKLHKSTKALESRLERLDVKAKPFEWPEIRMDVSLTKPPVSKTVLSVEGLTVSYGTRTVLDNVNLRVANGEHLAVTGGNGTGKTTLFNAILSRDEAVRVAPGVVFGYVSQTLDTLDERRTLLDNALYDSVQSRTVTQTTLARLLLTERDYHKTVAQLSGGERLKLCLCKLLCGSANVLVLDEPTNYLDIYALEALESLINGYQGTVLFTSHDRAFVTQCAHRVFSLTRPV